MCSFNDLYPVVIVCVTFITVMRVDSLGQFWGVRGPKCAFVCFPWVCAHSCVRLMAQCQPRACRGIIAPQSFCTSHYHRFNLWPLPQQGDRGVVANDSPGFHYWEQGDTNWGCWLSHLCVCVFGFSSYCFSVGYLWPCLFMLSSKH